MTGIVATNITSPLGFTTEENYRAIRLGKSALGRVDSWGDVPGRLCISQFSSQQWSAITIEGFTSFESMVIRSVREALTQVDVDLASSRTVFILSTTKGNVGELAPGPEADGPYLGPGQTAWKIARHLGFTTEPLVVCNACISGIAAEILADRLITSGAFDTAVVSGADSMTAFTLAGFTSFKALSPYPCRPFDIERLGLNLGEGAATVVMRKVAPSSSSWKLLRGCLDNDAYHVSAPSPDGDGVFRVMAECLEGVDREDLATITAHGTATMYNDQMESKAIEASGLGSVPVTAYKGCFGHTLGAAGIIESVITMRALDDGLVLPVAGFEEIGVSGRISVCDSLRESDRQSFLKIISGFGGCNGAAVFSRRPCVEEDAAPRCSSSVRHAVRITPESASIDGRDVHVAERGKALLTEVYKSSGLDGLQKFYKMDVFSRLAYLAAGLLLKEDGEEHACEQVSLLFFNSSGSILQDRLHLRSFVGADGFYPSPATFIYTLPNVVEGEIAMKYGVKGETTFIILRDKDPQLMERVISSALPWMTTPRTIAGWVECSAEDTFEAELQLITKN